LCQQAITLVSLAILARLLRPSDYGLLGMAVVVTGFVEVFKDLGTSSALVQRKELPDELTNSVFWMNVLLGFLAAAILAIMAPWVALFYQEPAVTAVILVLSISFGVSGLSVVHQALLIRQMAFEKLARVEISSGLVSALIAIAFAATGRGVWSLVAASLASSTLGTVLLWWVSAWRPTWQVHWRSIRSIISYSLNLSGFNVLNYVTRNSDNLLVGRYLGGTALGYYSLAYNLMLFPLQNISWVVGRVLFPAFAQVQYDNTRLRQAYLRVCSMIASVTFPLMFGMLALAGPLVETVYGSQWTSITTVVMILAPVGMVQSVLTTVGQIYLAKGRTDWMFRWGLVTSLMAALAFLVGLAGGISGVAFAYAVATILLVYPNFAIPFRLIDLRVRDLALALWPQFRYSCLVFGTMLFVRIGLALARINESWAVLLIAGLTGSFVYVGLMLLRKPPVVRDLVDLLPRDRVPVLRRLALHLGFIVE
jgi:PST family polysaccharide transporter